MTLTRPAGQHASAYRPLVLFLCTYNATRSIMAEALLNHLSGSRYRAASAGDEAVGALHPMTLAVLRNHGIDVAGLRSKNWTQVVGFGAPRIDYLITVCDDSRERMSVPSVDQPIKAHWDTPAPLVEGPAEQVALAFEATYQLVRARIEAFLRLPLSSMSREKQWIALMDLGRTVAATTDP